MDDMKAYKIELLVIDYHEIGENELKNEITNINYPNDCINPIVKSIECRDIGEWNDDHPLNKNSTHEEEYKKLFKN